jgi:hypothetical protein
MRNPGQIALFRSIAELPFFCARSRARTIRDFWPVNPSRNAVADRMLGGRCWKLDRIAVLIFEQYPHLRR